MYKESPNTMKGSHSQYRGRWTFWHKAFGETKAISRRARLQRMTKTLRVTNVCVPDNKQQLSEGETTGDRRKSETLTAILHGSETAQVDETWVKTQKTQTWSMKWGLGVYVRAVGWIVSPPPSSCPPELQKRTSVGNNVFARGIFNDLQDEMYSGP